VCAPLNSVRALAWCCERRVQDQLTKLQEQAQQQKRRIEDMRRTLV
jgi:hypothetical protein